MNINREYIIFNVSELDDVDFTQVLETSKYTVRKSIDETKTFVKWEGDEPAFVSTLSAYGGPYTHEEISAIMNTPEWTEPIDEE